MELPTQTLIYITAHWQSLDCLINKTHSSQSVLTVHSLEITEQSYYWLWTEECQCSFDCTLTLLSQINPPIICFEIRHSTLAWSCAKREVCEVSAVLGRNQYLVIADPLLSSHWAGVSWPDKHSGHPPSLLLLLLPSLPAAVARTVSGDMDMIRGLGVVCLILMWAWSSSWQSDDYSHTDGLTQSYSATPRYILNFERFTASNYWYFPIKWMFTSVLVTWWNNYQKFRVVNFFI